MFCLNAILVAGWALGFSLILLGAALLAFVALTTTASSLLIHWGSWENWWTSCYQHDHAFEIEEVPKVPKVPACVLRSVRRLTIEFVIGLFLYGLVLFFLLHMDRLCRQANGLDDTSLVKKRGAEVPVRSIEPGDVCPVCLDPLQVKQQPLEFCTYGCGKAVHQNCKERWTKKLRDDFKGAQCVYCRAPWGTNKSALTKLMNVYTNRTELD